MQSSTRRLLWEIGLGALAIAAMFGVWKLQEWRIGKQITQLEADHQAQLAQQVEETERWAAELGYQQAELVFQSFAAGIRGDLEAERIEDVTTAIDLMIRLEPVLFVHVLGPDGTVLGTTDRKLEITGESDERARWALEANELVVRTGLDQLVEIAGPIQAGEDGPKLAVLWLGYQDTGLAERIGGD